MPKTVTGSRFDVDSVHRLSPRSPVTYGRTKVVQSQLGQILSCYKV